MEDLGFAELTVDQLNSLVFYLGASVIFLLGVIITLCVCSRQDIVAGCSNAFLWYFLLPLLVVTVTYNSHSTIENALRTYGLKLEEEPNGFYYTSPPQGQRSYEYPMKDNRGSTTQDGDTLIPKMNFFKDLVEFAYRESNPSSNQGNTKNPKDCVTETIEETNEKGDKVISARIKCL